MRDSVRAWHQELERLGNRVTVADHLDNTGLPCRNFGPNVLVWDMREHDCCYWCNDEGDRHELGPVPPYPPYPTEQR